MLRSYPTTTFDFISKIWFSTIMRCCIYSHMHIKGEREWEKFYTHTANSNCYSHRIVITKEANKMPFFQKVSIRTSYTRNAIIRNLKQKKNTIHSNEEMESKNTGFNEKNMQRMNILWSIRQRYSNRMKKWIPKEKEKKNFLN